MPSLRDARILAVHAHPDDEALWTGGFLALAAHAGAKVGVVTCTLGEQGEVIGEPLANLVADASDQLGGFRISELRESLKILGAEGYYLGAPGKWRDSGMVGDPAQDHPRAFVQSGDSAVADLRAVVEEFQPDILVTYGPDGGYGHPDHIRAHEITMAVAVELGIDYVLWAVTEQRCLERGLAAINTAPHGWRMPQAGEIACVEDTDLAFDLDASSWEAKRAAMRAHATQLWIADGSLSTTNPIPAFAAIADTDITPAVFALSNLVAQPLMPQEHYQFAPMWPQDQRAVGTEVVSIAPAGVAAVLAAAQDPAMFVADIDSAAGAVEGSSQV
ncbi:MAG: N-acetyl-1-D-myo-inositol-2-amino-2-deoxy-alpha-D-glucopyranoside deacetylase [Corynebacterium sp.]|nr:N-acetyl-1-D-myo-inositol-2-amino-2-deoxy-alpha-D-glucopyranoside deacetylase [Corynebacterium sp.]